MDPDAALAELLALANDVLNDEAVTYPDNLGADATRLAEGVQALHTFITSGGFLPAAWRATVGAVPIAGADANGDRVAGCEHYYVDKSGMCGWPSCVKCGAPMSTTEARGIRACCGTPDNENHKSLCQSVDAIARREQGGGGRP